MVRITSVPGAGVRLEGEVPQGQVKKLHQKSWNLLYLSQIWLCHELEIADWKYQYTYMLVWTVTL